MGTPQTQRRGVNVPEARTARAFGEWTSWTLPSAIRLVINRRGAAATSPYSMYVEGVMEVKARVHKEDLIGFENA